MKFSPENLWKAKVKKVHSVNRVELCIELGFGCYVERLFTLEDVRVKDIPVEDRRAAVHALVVLIGGKRVLVQPENTSPDAKVARVYLVEKIYGSPVGVVMHAPNVEVPILDVSVFYSWLRPQSFAIDEVRAVVNGNPHHKHTEKVV